jgi:hypothetical protein
LSAARLVTTSIVSDLRKLVIFFSSLIGRWLEIAFLPLDLIIRAGEVNSKYYYAS